MIRFTLPAITPLVSAMTTGSAAESLQGQIVVDAPCKARGGDQQSAFVDTNALALPGQRHGACKNRRRAEEQPSVDIFLIDDPSDRHGRQSLEIEEQRAGCGGRAGQPEHQEQRA